MKSAVRVKGVVSSSGRLRLLEPVRLPAGECEVIVFPVAAPASSEPDAADSKGPGGVGGAVG
ncbi:MAG: hypothetical protein HY303_07285 [Candidatus Wallbacteria bacterium]|nr:hypothetical protein [Candidatus Wallbacteria bacterium]